MTSEWTHAPPIPEHAISDPPELSAAPDIETPTTERVRGRGSRPSTAKKLVTARKRPALEKSRKDEVLQHERARPQRMNVSPPDPEPFDDQEPVPVVVSYRLCLHKCFVFVLSSMMSILLEARIR